MKKGVIQKILILILVSVLIELFVFNIRCFQSMFYQENALDGSSVVSIEGGHVLENGDVELDEESDNIELTITNIDIPLKNVRLDVEIMDEDVSMWQVDNVCLVEVYVLDEALHEYMGNDGMTYLESSLYRSAGKSVVKDIEMSKYFWMETYGNTKALRINICSASGQGRIFRINSIDFNARQNMNISVLRFAAIFLTISLLYLLLFEKRVWDADCITPAAWKVMVPLLFFIALAAVSFGWAMSNPQILNTLPNEYAPLARALLQGKTYVGEGSDFVKEYSENIVFWNPNSNEVMFDYAYYDGKYYVYFGILPCIMFFLPYLLVTGRDLPNYIPVIILCLTVMVEIYVLLGMIVRRYYRKTPYVARFLMAIAAAFGMYIPLFISVSDQYMIPLFMAVTLTLGGIMLCMKGVGTDEHGCLVPFWGYLSAGSLCFALVSLCRPTLLVYGFAYWAVLLFYRRGSIAKMKRRRIMTGILSVALPYFVIATVCMYYNYVRFDSAFDFGAAKNMTTIPFNGGIGYLPYIIFRTFFEYLFASGGYSAEYPFVIYNCSNRIIEGGSILYVSKPGVGLFISAPILWLGALCFYFQKRLKKKGIFWYLIAMLACALFLMVFDSVFTCWIADRYTMDFSFVFFAWAFVAIMELREDFMDNTGTVIGDVVLKGITLVLLMTIFIGGLMILPENGYRHLLYGNTELYYRLYYAMNFML